MLTISRFRERRAARARYFEHADMAGSLLSDLFDYTDRGERIKNLGLLAFTAGAMARECKVFDNNRYDNMGYKPAEWHQAEASLFLLVEAAETGDWGEVEMDSTAHSLWLDPRIDDILHRIGAADGLEEKGRLLLELRNEVTPYVGGQAGEALVSLAHVYLVTGGMSGKDAIALAWPHTAGR